MKQFFNVLYRRILYRIPLKWLLVLLVVFALGIASFSDATTVSNQDVNNLFGFDHYTINGSVNVREHGGNYNGVVCIIPEYAGTLYDGTITYNFNAWQSYCTDSDTVIVSMNGSYYIYYIYIGTEFLDVFAPELTSLQCQIKYSLIPVSSVDSNYCTTNNLCPSCPSCPIGSGGISNVYINDILHVGASNIYMNIAEEIDWDYAYTQGGNNMNIDIVGYNVDYEKMQEQIDIQNFKPDSSDLSTIISEIIPLFVPGLCIILLLYFIFRFIKKIF